eukprot:SRR837773.11161.p2 GENE.SRR837773.11161~~SRR837773.11161.p2  ORF type:complete len:121 (-),score=13.40 SRR837773.11161:162-524(-)
MASSPSSASPDRKCEFLDIHELERQSDQLRWQAVQQEVARQLCRAVTGDPAPEWPTSSPLISQGNKLELAEMYVLLGKGIDVSERADVAEVLQRGYPESFSPDAAMALALDFRAEAATAI